MAEVIMKDGEKLLIAEANSVVQKLQKSLDSTSKANREREKMIQDNIDKKTLDLESKLSIVCGKKVTITDVTIESDGKVSIKD